MSWNENSAQPSAQLAIPGLPTEVVVFHVLKSENFRDPGHLAQLRVVSHAVAATGHPVNDLTEEQYVELGCVNALQRLQRGGTLSKEELLCEVAARCGQLEELQQLRENGCPWDEVTCSAAAGCGHLEVLQWARATGCLWIENTCSAAARGGHLEVLQ
jgi:hypothetical protein